MCLLSRFRDSLPSRHGRSARQRASGFIASELRFQYASRMMLRKYIVERDLAHVPGRRSTASTSTSKSRGEVPRARRDIRTSCRVTDGADALLRAPISWLVLSARAYHRILKIARPIADLDDAAELRPEAVSEAVQYRPLDRRGQGRARRKPLISRQMPREAAARRDRLAAGPRRSILKHNSDARNPGTRCRAARPCPGGSKSRNRLSETLARPVVFFLGHRTTMAATRPAASAFLASRRYHAGRFSARRGPSAGVPVHNA